MTSTDSELAGEPRPVEAMVVLPNRLGLHARSAALLVKASARYRSAVTLATNGRTARAASLTDLLRLGARQGDSLHITAVGPDAEAALHEFKTLIESGFNED